MQEKFITVKTAPTRRSDDILNDVFCRLQPRGNVVLE